MVQTFHAVSLSCDINMGKNQSDCTNCLKCLKIVFICVFCLVLLWLVLVVIFILRNIEKMICHSVCFNTTIQIQVKYLQLDLFVFQGNGFMSYQPEDASWIRHNTNNTTNFLNLPLFDPSAKRQSEIASTINMIQQQLPQKCSLLCLQTSGTIGKMLQYNCTVYHRKVAILDIMFSGQGET